MFSLLAVKNRLFEHIYGGIHAAGAALSWKSNTLTITSDAIIGVTGALSVKGGNVGIGTTNPTKLLHIAAGESSYGMVRISPSAAGGETTIGFFDSVNATDTNDAWLIGQNGWGNTGDFVIGNENNGAGGNVRLLIEKGGNLGIGTANPAVKLHVAGAGVNSICAQSTDGKFVELRAGGLGGSFSFDSTGFFQIGMNNEIGETNQDTTIMRLNADTNVGIGWTSPTTRLDVNGTIRSKGVQWVGQTITGSTACTLGANSPSSATTPTTWQRVTLLNAQNELTVGFIPVFV